MNTDFVKMCIKNAIDEVNGSEASEGLKKEFFRKMTDVAIVLKKMERAKK